RRDRPCRRRAAGHARAASCPGIAMTAQVALPGSAHLPDRRRIYCTVTEIYCHRNIRASGGEDEAGSGVGAQQFRGHLCFGHLVERLARAVQRYEVIEVDRLERGEG